MIPIVPIEPGTHHYTDAELTLPEGASREDVAWTAFSWDLKTVPDPFAPDRPEIVIHHILVPGMLMFREGRLTGSTWKRRPRNLPEELYITRRQPSPEKNISDHATQLVSGALNDGFQWGKKPFAFTVEPSEALKRKLYSAVPELRTQTVEKVGLTLGDAMELSRYEIGFFVYNSSLEARRKLA